MNNTQELMGLEILRKKLIRPAMECLKMIVLFLDTGINIGEGGSTLSVGKMNYAIFT